MPHPVSFIRVAGILLATFYPAFDPAFAADLTFFATSDVHYGKDGAPYDSNRAQVLRDLNALPGQAYPAAAGGGSVGEPRGVLIPGDLVDHPDTAYWNRYIHDYGVNGEGVLRFPVYDGLGNHDEPGVSALIEPLFIRRNGQRHGVQSFDSLNYHYSWDWDNIHFVNLNLYSGTTQGNGTGNPLSSVDFLRRDLDQNVGSSGRPIFILQHYPYDSSDTWWNGSEKEKTWAVMRNYNVIALLHGHTHSKKFYAWNGINVFDDGAALYGDELVFHITEGRLLVLNREQGKWGKLLFDQNISMGSSAALVPRIPAPALRRSVADFLSLPYALDGSRSLFHGIRLCRSLGGQRQNPSQPSGRRSIGAQRKGDR